MRSGLRECRNYAGFGGLKGLVEVCYMPGGNVEGSGYPDGMTASGIVTYHVGIQQVEALVFGRWCL